MTGHSSTRLNLIFKKLVTNTVLIPFLKHTGYSSYLQQKRARKLRVNVQKIFSKKIWARILCFDDLSPENGQ